MVLWESRPFEGCVTHPILGHMLPHQTVEPQSEGAPGICARESSSELDVRRTNLRMFRGKLWRRVNNASTFGVEFHSHVLPFSADMKAGGPVDNGFVKPEAGSSSS